MKTGIESYRREIARQRPVVVDADALRPSWRPAGRDSAGSIRMTPAASACAFAIVLLAACSKSEPPPQAKTAPPAPIVAPAPTPGPVPEPVVPQQAAPVPAVQQHIPGSPDAKAFVAANVEKQPKKRAPTRVVVPETAYEKAYRNAARADKLLQRHAYVTGFDDVAATNAVPLSREYR